jgi:hypothetical protein
VSKSGVSLRLAARRRARKLASLLGEDHDLALLRARIREPGGGDTSARLLLALRIKRRRRRLRDPTHASAEYHVRHRRAPTARFYPRRYGYLTTPSILYEVKSCPRNKP